MERGDEGEWGFDGVVMVKGAGDMVMVGVSVMDRLDVLYYCYRIWIECRKSNKGKYVLTEKKDKERKSRSFTGMVPKNTQNTPLRNVA